MSRYALAHLSDATLLRALRALIARERGVTAELVAHIGEVDARKLYLPAGYPSMFAYCVGELRLSEDAAYKRIQAARAARRFPALLDALAGGRLHLSAVSLLVPHLTEENAAELMAAATHQSKAAVERWLAERFPRTDLMAWVAAMPAASPADPAGQLAPGQVGAGASPAPDRPAEAQRPAAGPVVGGPVPRPGEPPSRVTALARDAYAVHFTLSRRGHELLCRAQALLGHEVPSGDIAAVVERALGVLVGQIEKRRFAATSRPRRSPGRSRTDSRHIPAEVRRAATEARADVKGRNEAADAQAVAQSRAAVEARWNGGTPAESRARRQTPDCAGATSVIGDDRDVVPWLRALGFTAAEARRGAERCGHIPDAPLEERVRVALSSFRARGTRVERSVRGQAPEALRAGAVPAQIGP